VKRSPTLSEWTELLDGNMTEGGALTGGMHAQPLKEYTSGSHTSGVTSCSDLRQRADGDMGSGTGSPPSQSGQVTSESMKGKAVGTPSGSTPLFQLGISPSSDSEDSEGIQGAPVASGRPIASQAKRDLLSIGAQLPPASENADLQSPSSGCQHTPPKGPFNR
jgi:hypothetical protein